MLLTTVVLWALNLSVTKYILEQGLEPLSYATVRYALAGAIFVVLTLAGRAHATDRAAPRSRARVRLASSVAESALLRLRARQDDRVDDRPDPWRDPDLRGAVRARPRSRATQPTLLARRGRVVRRRRARRGRSGKRGLGRLRGDPARARNLRDLGRLLGGGRAAHGHVLAVAGQRRRHSVHVGPPRAHRHPADDRSRTGIWDGRSGRCSCSRRSDPSC